MVKNIFSELGIKDKEIIINSDNQAAIFFFFFFFFIFFFFFFFFNFIFVQFMVIIHFISWVIIFKKSWRSTNLFCATNIVKYYVIKFKKYLKF